MTEPEDKAPEPADTETEDVEVVAHGEDGELSTGCVIN